MAKPKTATNQAKKENTEEVIENAPQKLDEENRKPIKPPTFQYFSFILYPQDNETNQEGELLDWIINDEILFPEKIWIEHDRDFFEKDDEKRGIKAGDPKKKHTHLLVKTNKRITVNGMIKRCDGIAEHDIEGVNDETAMARYFLHRTFASRHSAQYDDEELHGTERLRSKAFIQNLYFAEDIAIDLCKKTRTLFEALDMLRESEYSIETKNLVRKELNRSYYIQLQNQRNSYSSKDIAIETVIHTSEKDGEVTEISRNTYLRELKYADKEITVQIV